MRQNQSCVIKCAKMAESLIVVRICADFTPNCSFLVTSTKLSGMIDFNVAVNIRYGAK